MRGIVGRCLEYMSEYEWYNGMQVQPRITLGNNFNLDKVHSGSGCIYLQRLDRS